MTLTEADIARLEAAGHHGFWRVSSSGDLQLLNRRGACVFLRDGSCRVYDERPEGCRFYPFVLDLADDCIVPDGHCPHRREFAHDRELADELRRSVAREDAERRRRRMHDW